MAPGRLAGHQSRQIRVCFFHATADYFIAISNSGGGARFVNLLDTSLLPGWTLAAPAPTYAYLPAQPLAAGVLSSGAETSASITTSPT